MSPACVLKTYLHEGRGEGRSRQAEERVQHLQRGSRLHEAERVADVGPELRRRASGEIGSGGGAQHDRPARGGEDIVRREVERDGRDGLGHPWNLSLTFSHTFVSSRVKYLDEEVRLLFVGSPAFKKDAGTGETGHSTGIYRASADRSPAKGPRPKVGPKSIATLT